MNQTLQLHNATIFHAEIPNFCTSCCVHVLSALKRESSARLSTRSLLWNLSFLYDVVRCVSFLAYDLLLFERVWMLLSLLLLFILLFFFFFFFKQKTAYEIGQ